MLQPVRTKYRKAFKGRINGKATRAAVLNYGTYGLKALEPERIIGKQIEAARVALTRYMKRTGRVWTRIFPNIPVSKKPTEVRMGKGKGAPEYYACRVKPGRIIFEIDGVSDLVAKEAFDRASSKLPIKTKVIKRNINI
jgi:large subunit ribosomal protein L16